jgi:hypothetical protein
MVLALFGLGFAGAAAGATMGIDGVWTPAHSPNGLFSVETPCSLSEVAALKGMPGSALPGGNSDPDTRVLCKQGDVLFFAGEIDGGSLPPGTSSLFDLISTQAANDKTAEGTPKVTTIDGRRAWINRQEEDGALAQTGFVEVGRTKIILLLAGVQGKVSLSVKQQGDAIDRFYSSVKVTGQ